MKKLDIKESIKINTNANKAWEIIGPNFLNIADWGPGISKSWNNEFVPVTFEGAPAGGRFCDLGKFGIADERILHYNDVKKEITWSARSNKLPTFIEDLQNELRVVEIDENTCRVTTNISAELTGIKGLLLGTLIKNNFTKLLKGFVIDWKTYSESGLVSDTKKRELDKLSKKQKSDK